MGADIALNKKILAGNDILKFIRRGELLSVAHLHGFDAEVRGITKRHPPDVYHFSSSLPDLGQYRSPGTGLCA